MMKRQMEDAHRQSERNLSFQFDYESFLIEYDHAIKYGNEIEKNEARRLFNDLIVYTSERYNRKKREEGNHMPSFYYVDKDSERKRG